ncbi:MAG: patatin-like phospholipase family protein [Gammaproteobacteria bacterium]|nr:patatin-like phospholipase family protein [Gammaproteobacteria bacterium]
MDNELINFLKTCKLFSSLNDSAIKKIVSQVSLLTLRPNEILFCQGAPSDNLFLLHKGEMVAILTTMENTTKILGHIEPGETIGELSALSGEPHTLTVKATKESVLLKLSRQDFVEICHLYPAIMYATVHPIISRTESIFHAMFLDKSPHTALLPMHSSPAHLPHFAKQFHALAENDDTIILISDFEKECENQNVDFFLQKIHEIERHKKKHQQIVYLLKAHDTPLAELSLKKADQLYLIADSQATPEIDPALLDKIEHRTARFKSYPQLILLHPEKSQIPQRTVMWLAQTKFELHHHVRIDSKSDYKRLIRFILGKAVGVVLGGGGTRGWAHLGAIKALQEAHIPIDIIGGTSVGAIVGACYALNESFTDAYTKFQSLIDYSRHSISWRSLTWPLISLFDAKNFTIAQLNIFQQRLMEDMWLPFFCISSNLANYTEYVHRQGLIWEKTRASSSIPGLIPPMVIDGELHLDGGLLNNLPVDVMRQFVGKKGKIIAVELNSSTIGDRKSYQFPPTFTFKEAFLTRIKRNRYNYRFPRFVDTFMRGLLIGSSAKTQQNSLIADIFVNVNLNQFRLLHINSKQADKIFELGYLEMKYQIERNGSSGMPKN